MAPPFISRMRKELPAEPPRENPYRKAADDYDDLHEYAQRVLRLAEETNENNQILTAQNASLQAEVDRLSDEVSALMRDNRLVRSYAEHLRTRLTVVRESMEMAERESLEYASHSVRVPHSEETQTEDDGAAEIATNIARLTPAPVVNTGTMMPPSPFKR